MSFFELRFGEDKIPVSKQNVSKQRSYLSPLIFKDAEENGLKEIYSEELTDLDKFKDYLLLNIDGSQFDIPNTPITREEFEVQHRALKKNESPKARVSAISDAKNEYILDSIISPFYHGEHSMAFENIENASQIIDFEKVIVNFDRGHPSTELYMQLLDKKKSFYISSQRYRL